MPKSEIVNHDVHVGECLGDEAPWDLHEEEHVALLVGDLKVRSNDSPMGGIVKDFPSRLTMALQKDCISD